ncbi:DUF4199 domain-containing protein [Pedobacter sp. SL55]|uniref:DUF4199 domain-containing protein n=1 Tax=Pedobacter sp. SL55 TaxID=2995161 RepID=UPI00227136CE|nr:DUF4199 domain-containing protein [Pedobacter sp. SL55]WAC40158.1 DUF4199 domain-containing protein [Pedobacter sp. SL55]
MEQQLAQEQKKPNLLAFQIALLYAIYNLALIYLSEAMGMGGANYENVSIGLKILSTALTYVPFIAAIIYVQTKHRSELGGFITFGRAFSAGFKVAAYAGLFIALLTVLYYKILSPGSMEAIIDAARAKAGSDEQQLKGIEMMSKYMILFMVFGLAVTFTISGLIISLISAAIVKKENPNPFARQADEQFGAN